jgi:2-polyprenyl-3-methyl-5-hydroxy-6-metoxy-1,4-benzoquinol methylase
MKCYHCGQSALLSFTSKDYNRRITEEKFDYYRCSKCDFIFLYPLPKDLGRFYPTEYYEVPKDEEELAARAEKLQSAKLDVLLRFATKGSLLEIGPAYGLFAFLAKRAGFEVTGIEMDSRCCDFLRSIVGITVVEGNDTLSLLGTLPKYDVIVLWQVIEHLPDPWTVLNSAAQHLVPGGVLIIDTPNPEAFQFRVFGARWTHVDAPRHVTLIPAQLLSEFAEKQGMKPIDISSNGAISRGYNSFGWAFSLKNFFRSAAAGSVAHLLGRVLNKLMIPIERIGLRGSTYTAVFKKDSSK